MTSISTASHNPQSAAAIALAPLDRISSALDTLVQTLQTSTTFPQLPSIVADLTTADDDLSSALQLLKQHQANHARILHLREEAVTLENNIRDSIRRARQLRSEITSIHPDIDERDSLDDNDGDDPPTVDYEQLLQFAARIGKHNSLAKQEAEQEGTRLKVEAKNARNKSEGIQERQQQMNAATTNGADQPTNAEENRPDITDHQAGELTAIADAFEASSRLPFTSPELLRKGALGRLEIIRESDPGDPDGAVEREVERMVRETENVAAAVVPVSSRPVAVDPGTKAAEQSRQQPQQQQQQHTSSRPSIPLSAQPPKPKKKVDLDFPGADSDDDDDDD